MDMVVVAVVGVVLLALLFDFTNGFHDAANSTATVVATKALKPRTAVYMAAFFNFAAPGAAVMEIAAVRDIKLISLPEDLVAKVVEKNPFLMPYTIKAGTYSSFTEDCHIIADGNYMVVNSNMKEDLAYNLVKTLLENRENFMEVTEQAKHFVPEEASRGIIPFHPGAVKYFTEQGVTMQ